MTPLHDTLAFVFGLILDPLATRWPLAGLTLLSTLSGVILLYLFRWTSRPAAIRAAKQRAQAHLLAVRLYKEDLGVVFRAQGRFLVALGRYLGEMLLPFAAALVPFALLFAHLDARFATRALQGGERTVLTAAVDRAELDRWQLDATGALVVDSKPVRIPARAEIVWRLRAAAAGEATLALTDGSRRVEQRLQVRSGDAGASASRRQASLASLFLAPATPALREDDGVRAIDLALPPLDLTLAGWRLHWLVVFLVVSAAVAFGLRRRVGVEF